MHGVFSCPYLLTISLTLPKHTTIVIMSGNSNAALEATRFEEGKPNSHVVTDSSTSQHIMSPSRASLTERPQRIRGRLPTAWPPQRYAFFRDVGHFPT